MMHSATRMPRTAARFICVALLLAALFAWQSAAVFSQQSPELHVESVRVAVGTRVALPLRLLASGSTIQETQTLEGRITLSNSSLLYLEEWRTAEGSQILASRLTRLNDSTYTFMLQIRRIVGTTDTIAYLRAEVLAGSDSVTTLLFHAVRLTNLQRESALAPTTATVTVQFVDSDAPFARFAELQPNAPNPVLRGTETRWAYTIDIPSDVTFIIYNAAAEEVERIERRQQSRGFHVETWIPTRHVAAGMYFVRFITNFGVAFQRLSIE
jgi:hypothetical protein